MNALLAPMRRYRKEAALAVTGTVGEVVMEVFLPFIMAYIIDEGVEAGNLTAVLVYGAAMLVMAALSLGFGMMAGYFSAKASIGYGCALREKIFDKVQTYSFANIDRFSTAGLVTRMTTDVTNVQMASQMLMRIAVRSPIMLISSLVAGMAISLDLSPVFFAAIIFLATALGVIVVFSTRIFNVVFDAYDDLNASVQENVAAIRVVKAFVREAYENEKFRAAADKLYRLFVRAEGLVALNNPVMMLAVYGCIIALSWLGAQLVVGSSMTTGELTSLFSYVMQILMSLMMLSMIVVMLTMSLASGRRIAEALDEQPDIANPAEAACSVADGSIDFDHVGFSYAHGDGEDVLQDIDLHIASGETIGIIGGTGSGKSSLVSLVSRLYDATEGTVRVGGLDVRAYDLETLRDAVAVVLQKNVLFSGTVAENLRWGAPDATDEELWAACDAAQASEFLRQLPEGLEARVERGGVNFSGGQKQRLCIARALLKRPKVLILDDSTSAVDTATDARIRAAFDTLIPGTTKIIIAQRISSVEHADRIVVMDGGRIDGVGAHEELLATNDIYRSVAASQAEGTGDFDIAAPSAAQD